jgi:hypothetical protein
MSSLPQGENQDHSLPFEPKQKKKKSTKKSPVTATKVAKIDSQQSSLKNIPKEVSQRMVKRMAIFSGFPTTLGMSSFFLFYLVVNAGIKIPPYLVFFVSLGLFGLGVLGLTYGILSTSWEEGRVGSLLGWSEFKLNFARTYSALSSGNKDKDCNET